MEVAVLLESHPPYPPFTKETALAKVKAAEDAWNTRDPHRVAMAYTVDTVWWRSYGSELWEFADNGLVARREASINDVRIDEWARRIFGPRPAWQCSAEAPLR